jgi:glycerate 2-kinase
MYEKIIMNDRIKQLIAAALAAVNPFNAIQTHLKLDSDRLAIGNKVINLTNKDIRCVAVGKASVPMARSICELLGNRISQGLVVTKYDHLGNAKFPDNWSAIESAHPVPDDRSLDAGDRVWKLLADCTEQTLVLACISGGASALAVAPRPWCALIELLNNPPTAEISQEIQQLILTALANQSIVLRSIDPEQNISLPALQAIGSGLLASGLSIEKINAVRSRIDRLKGGGLVGRAGDSKVIGLILSDVIGDPIASISSGLTNHRRADNVLVGNNLQACKAVAKAARGMGYDSQIVTTELDGEAQIRGEEIARKIVTQPAKTVLIYGGETTVNLPKHCTGKGGRNTELGLAAAIELAKQNTPAWIITLATDGTDGPTDAAGATVNETTIDRALELGLDAKMALDRHDSYSFFERLKDLHLIGATGTNVADITIAIRP